MATQIEKTLLEMLVNAPKFIGSQKNKVNNQRRVSFPARFRQDLAKFNEIYKGPEKEIIILNPEGSRIYSILCSDLLKEKQYITEIEQAKESGAEKSYTHPKIIPIALYEATANVIQAHYFSDICTAFFSSPERMNIDGQGRILLPSDKVYDRMMGGYVNFIGVGPSIDLMLEPNDKQD